MKNWKRASLIFGFLLWTALLMDRFYVLGVHTEYNHQLWLNITRTKDLPKIDKQDQKEMYLTLKQSFAFAQKGDN